MKVEFVTGEAGTGKTYTLKQRIIEAKEKVSNGKGRYYGSLCATTGIAAVNLSGGTGDSVSTINSELRFFDTENLQDRYAERKLHEALEKVAQKGANLVVDELSMMEALQLDLIYQAMLEVNELSFIQRRGGLGLVLSGDFCQLPPVKGKFAFEAKCWPKIAENITKLTKVWRQDNVEFLKAINAARRGDGDTTAEVLEGLHTSKNPIFVDCLSSKYDGTTICALNRDVDSINKSRLIELLHQGKREIKFKTLRWGKQRGEWKNIPEENTFAIDAYCMILANNPPDFDYANGDCGILVDVVGDKQAVIELVRNGLEVQVKTVIRRVYEKTCPPECEEPPEAKKFKEWSEEKDALGTTDRAILKAQYRSYLLGLTLQYKQPFKPYFDFEENKWVVGEITYMPLRLAYASTVHKTQGLTLDRVQIDPYAKFFGEPSMMYVALSRVRSPEGLRIVGSPKLVVERTNIVEDILPWI